MTTRKLSFLTVDIAAVAIIIVAVLLAMSLSNPAAKTFETESAELRMGTRARLFEGAEAKAAGVKMLEAGKIRYTPDKTWDGEVPFGAGNDWEPSIAADPNASYVYAATTRFGDRLCATCPNPTLMLRISDDNGATWGPAKPFCKCPVQDGPAGRWQYDPTIEVAEDGSVHATILSKWETLYVRSDDHGATWTDPVSVEDSLPWTDHGFLTVSPDGQDIYVAFNQVRSKIVASHDGGVTWGPPVTTNVPGQNQYYYSYRGTVLPDDSIVIALSAVPESPYAKGPVQYYVARSTDMGATWSQIQIDDVKRQPDCYTYKCHSDHWAGLSSVDSDEAGNLVYSYVGSTVPQQGQLMFTRTSTDGGQTWSARRTLSPEFAGSRRVIAAFPAVAGTTTDEFTAIWMDNRKRYNRWNTWASETTDGGMTWSPGVRISDAQNGAPYKHPAGYEADYGDYLDLDIMSNGKAIGTWGEAFSYWGPGGTWINREA